MIVMLILIGIVVVGLLGSFIIFAVADHRHYEYGEEAAVGFLGTGLFTLVPLAICGLICIVANSSNHVATQKYELEQTVILLKNKKAIVESYHPVAEGNKSELTSDITLENISTSDYYALVNSYNKEVFNFKTSVVKHQIRRDNPWTSWFWSPAYSVITTETLDSLIYTVGK